MMNWGDERLPSTFWSKVIPEPNSGCWLWIGAQDRYGYGRFGVKRGKNFRAVLSHRAAFSAANGNIPGRLVLDHLCRTPCCCNPTHLEAVTQGENVRRGNAGRHHSSKTECKNGHRFDVANTIHRVRAGVACRECRACHRDANVRYANRNPASIPNYSPPDIAGVLKESP